MRFTHLVLISLIFCMYGCHDSNNLEHGAQDYYYSAIVKTISSKDNDTTFYYPQVWVSLDSNIELGGSVYIKVDSMPVWFKPGERRAKPTSSAWSNNNGSYWQTSYKDTLQFSNEINFIERSILRKLLTYPLHHNKPRESLNQDWFEKISSNQEGQTLQYSLVNGEEKRMIIYQLDKNQMPLKQQRIYESNGYLEYYEIVYHKIHFNQIEIQKTINETLPNFPIKVYQVTKPTDLIPDINIGDQFPNLRVEDLKGDSTNILNNKELQLIDFWFLACPPCMKSIPTTIKLLERLNIDKQIEFTTINGMDYEHKNAVKNWSKSVGLLPSQILFINRETLRGKYGIIGFPTLILLKEGQIVEIFDGWDNDQDELLEERILHHLKN
jgi:thiol-disulfide isomerase/thioredoxin